MGPAGAEVPGDEISVEILPGESATIRITDAYNAALDLWQGRIAVSNEKLGRREITLEYATQPQGQWSGSIHYFLNFDDRDLDGWITALHTGSWTEMAEEARRTQNAFLAKWTEFRTNPLFSQREWSAVTDATLSGAWEFTSVQEGCAALFGGSAGASHCYVYADANEMADPGLRVYTDTADLRIPQGVVALPLTLRLQNDGNDSQGFVGRVETTQSMHYPGNPPVALRFAQDPSSCEVGGGAACLVPIESFDLEALVGGRMLLADEGSCDPGGSFISQQIPWLVPHFLGDTKILEDGSRVKEDCRESTFPELPTMGPAALANNASFAGANPIADGRVRRRRVDLLDGVMINQRTLFLIVREEFDANLGSTEAANFNAYGLIILERSGANIPSDGYMPGRLPADDELSTPTDALEMGCSEGVLDEILGPDAVLPGNEDRLASLLLYGRDTTNPPESIDDLSRVHFLCHGTGRFDHGPSAWTAEGGEPCPAGSGVTFFLYDGASDLKDHPCQGEVGDRCLQEDCPQDQRGECAEVLQAISLGPTGDTTLNPPFVCKEDGGEDPDLNRVLCSEDRYDLFASKLFYDPTDAAGEVFQSLAQQVDAAFRYKTRFKSRTGQSVGFVPAICELNSDALPYCFDPPLIEQVRDKMDCLQGLYADSAISDPMVRQDTEDFLKGSFSFFGDGREGFERLYAELLIMLGDEALTDAVASRFDLAGTAVAAFNGDLLEPGGIQLSGGAGNEMLLLYRGHQYFQMVMDRFNQRSPMIWGGLQDESINVITLNSISTYFNRLILASTKKAQVAAEIARRYQGFNRADLARHVVQRSYTEAYLESVTISQLMRSSIAVLEATEVDALRHELAQAQRRYRQALRKMREAYQDITDELTFFGDPPDYIPFPAPGRFDEPVVRLMLERAFEMLDIAREREDRALDSNRDFDTDAASFQAELSRIRSEYDNQLGEICGFFVGDDGQARPATKIHSGADPFIAVLPEPCGFFGSGSLWDARAGVDSARLDLRSEIADLRALMTQVEIEEARVAQECAGRVAIAEMVFKSQGKAITLGSKISDLQTDIADWERRLSVLDRKAASFDALGQAASSVQDSIVGCAGASPESKVACAAIAATGTIAFAAYGASALIQAVAHDVQVEANESVREKEGKISNLETDIAELERGAEYHAALMECCLDPDGAMNGHCQSPGPLMVNSQARVDDLLVGLMREQIEALKADVEMRRASGRVNTLHSQAIRLQSQQAETEQHLLNVEAARNDPNTRIYANADVLDADRSFYQALTDAYRATRTYEYYTATSYAAKGDLFLVRMAGRGENNLQDYVIDLQRAFNDFEQVYGSPSLRVAMLSLRDDIFRVPHLDGDGRPLVPAARIELFQERLSDVNLLDERGHIRIPFSTSLNMVSPQTAIHKISYVEAEFQGSDLGDRVGRLYLSARGTATMRTLDGREIYLRPPAVNSVLNPYFNGARAFSDEVYRDFRLKDRPFINSLWEVGLNLRDESVNQDLNLGSFSDVRLYFFYEDFAQP
jgi:hypothetical protein